MFEHINGIYIILIKCNFFIFEELYYFSGELYSALSGPDDFSKFKFNIINNIYKLL